MADDYVVSRAATIDAPPARVRDLLVDFRAWQQWSPWEDLDPAMERTYTGAEQGEGATYAWRGNRKAGAGSMEITRAEDRRIDVAVTFTRPFRSTSTSRFLLDPLDDGATAVTWQMTGRRTVMTRLMEVFTSMDAMMGPDFERGLARLGEVATGT